MSKRLSKSRFQTGLQCPRALWLTCHRPDLADPIGEFQQHVFDTGTAVGELARRRFVGGVLVAEDHTQSSEAIGTTRRLFEDPPTAVFEAAFSHGGVFVRPDVLVRTSADEWDIYEVKSSTKLKTENITDVAVQTWVLEGSGLRIRRIHLMHLDNTYRYAGGDHDLDRLFVAEDVTAATRTWLPNVPAKVAEFLSMLEGPEPRVPIGRHCDKPYQCAYYELCHRFLPPRPVTALPRINASLLDSLIADGVYSLDDVPLDYPGLTPAQREVCELLKSDAANIVGDVSVTLSPLVHPIHFLDFETVQSALPLFLGTRPWQQIPFQWSDHVLWENGDVEHREFLHEGTGDPRPSFARSLLDALGESGSVVVYTAFESTRLSELADALPEYADSIAAVQTRLFDLERAVARHVRHPECLGRTSIKVVLPALVDDVSYAGLEIQEGGIASTRYLQALTGKLSSNECSQLYADLREYCGTDTRAMVRLLDVLRSAER